MIGLALTNHGAWGIALIIGLVAALAVAGLLLALIRTTGQIRRSTGQLLEVAGAVAGNTSNIPQLEATAPVLGKIVDEAVVQDGYMNALTDGYGPAATAAAETDGAA
jgi:predicted permease